MFRIQCKYLSSIDSMSQMLFIELKNIIPKGMDSMLNNVNISATITEKTVFLSTYSNYFGKTLNALH